MAWLSQICTYYKIYYIILYYIMLYIHYILYYFILLDILYHKTCYIIKYMYIYDLYDNNLRAYGRGTEARGKESERHLMDCSCGVIS